MKPQRPKAEIDYGLFSESVQSCDVVLGDGRLVHASPHENADLFNALPWSQGSLGFVVAMEIAVIPAARFVHVTYHPAHSTRQACELMEREACRDNPAEFVEGMLFSPREGVVTTGVFSDKAAPGKIHNAHRWYSEIFRILKPGGLFVLHEWCLTNRYDASNPEHLRLKFGIEIGNGLPELAPVPEVVSALKNAGFELLETWDAALDSDPETPWYRGLEGKDLSLTSVPRTPIGRAITNVVTRALEALRVFPQGTTAVSTLLNHAADDLVAAGRAGIFTPLLYAKARRM